MITRRGLVICLCLMVLVSSGCAPLKKKFTRQKKKDKEDLNFVPVLEPVDYPAKIHGAKEAYAQHFSLFKVWFSDFDTARRQNANEKKLVGDLDSALKELDEMARLLKSPSSDELAKLRVKIQYIRDEYDKPASFRNQARISSEFRDADMGIRKNFKPDALGSNFVDES